jgi:hypothetical protein
MIPVQELKVLLAGRDAESLVGLKELQVLIVLEPIILVLAAE